jgi:hypothetical protein
MAPYKRVQPKRLSASSKRLAGFLGQLFYALSEPSVGFPYLIRKFADLTLHGAP